MTDIISLICDDLILVYIIFQKNIFSQFKMNKKGNKPTISIVYIILSNREFWQFLAGYSYRAMVTGYKI